MVELRLLGGLSLSADGARLSPPVRSSALKLLVWLLLEDPDPIGRDRASSLFSPTLSADESRARLRVLLHAARTWLSGTGARAEWVAADRDRLWLAEDHAVFCDAVAFRRGAQRVGAVAGERLEANILEDALRTAELYRGPLLPGDDFEPFEAHRHALADEHGTLLLRLAGHYGAVGDWRSAEVWSRELLASQPDSPRAVAAVMRVLLGAGDRGAALSVYEAFEAGMGSDGVADEDLAIWFREVAGESIDPDVARPTATAPSGSLPSRALQRRTSFVGRGQELSALAAAIGHSQVVTIVGPGGTGKTRIATEIGSRFGDRFTGGVWTIDLGAVEHESQVLAAAARALGVDPVPSQTLHAGIGARLEGLSALVILDNCEHVIGASRAVVETLRTAGTEIRVVATSRVPLDVERETVWPLPPLSLPPAHTSSGGFVAPLTSFEAPQLFCERASLADSQLLADDALAASVGSICRGLDGIPLAIEIAASWTSFLDITTIDTDLRTLSLTVGDHSAMRPDRQRTLGTTIEWSYRLLPAHLQRLFRRLAVFAGPFSAADALQLYADDAERPSNRAAARAMLDRLADNSMLVGRTAPQRHTTFGFLQVLRDYARSSLAAEDDPDLWHDRHAARMAAIAGRYGPQLRGPKRSGLLARLAERHDDLAAAVTWSRLNGRTERSLILVGDLWGYWSRPRAILEARELLEPVVDTLDASASPGSRARARLALGYVLTNQGDYAGGSTTLERALVEFTEAGDTGGRGACLSHLSRVATNRGDYRQSERYGIQALRIFRVLADRSGIAETLQSLAESAARQHKLDRAARLYRRSLSGFRLLRDREGMANALVGLALVSMKRADLELALEQVQRAMRLRQRSGTETGMASTLSILGGIYTARGELDSAQRAYESSLKRYRDAGHIAGITVVLHNLGDVAWSRGDLSGAAAYFQQAMDMPHQSAQMDAWLPYRMAEVCLMRGDLDAAQRLIQTAIVRAEMGHLDDVVAEALRLSARLAGLRAERVAAADHLGESLRIWQRSGGVEGALRAFDTLAELLVHKGESERAVTLIAAIDHVRRERSCARAVPDQQLVDQCLHVTRATLGPAAFRAAERAGSGMELDSLWSFAHELGEA